MYRLKVERNEFDQAVVVLVYQKYLRVYPGKCFCSWGSSRSLMASRINSWSLVRTLICLKIWLKKSSKSEMDVANSSICRGSSKVSERFFQFYRL
jgi:hypothetical protein